MLVLKLALPRRLLSGMAVELRRGDGGGRPVLKLPEEFAALPPAELFIGGKVGKKLKLAYRNGKFGYLKS